jgi:16S rRNA (cytosine967-C5)-methyltransferase
MIKEMKIASARQSAFGALLAIDRGAWSAEALAAKSVHLDSRDAGLASDIVFGTLRRREELDAMIGKYSKRGVDKLDAAVRTALEMALYQIRFLDRVPGHAAVNDSVELARRAGKASAAAFVNAILRRAIREPVEIPETLSTPAWLLDRWIAQYGSDTARAIAQASLRPPERFIRVGNASPPPGAEPTDVPGCFRLASGDASGFRFQDIGSQAVVPLLSLEPGQTFLDLCASPGNKTAQALETPIKAIACDLHLSRARLLLPLSIPAVTLDATKPLPFARRFDRILVDAPCSGTGTLARNPEIKWRLKPEDIADLQNRQVAILRNALAQLTPDGLLVYSTCSLEREENQEVVALAGATVVETMQRLPGRDPGDGFFAAVLRGEVLAARAKIDC